MKTILIIVAGLMMGANAFAAIDKSRSQSRAAVIQPETQIAQKPCPLALDRKAASNPNIAKNHRTTGGRTTARGAQR